MCGAKLKPCEVNKYNKNILIPWALRNKFSTNVLLVQMIEQGEKKLSPAPGTEVLIHLLNVRAV